MIGNAVHKSLYQNSEICGFWIRVSGPKVGPVWPYGDFALILCFRLYYHSYGKYSYALLLCS